MRIEEKIPLLETDSSSPLLWQHETGVHIYIYIAAIASHENSKRQAKLFQTCRGASDNIFDHCLSRNSCPTTPAVQLA